MTSISIGHLEASCHDGCWKFCRSGDSTALIEVDRFGGLRAGHREICQLGRARAIQLISEKLSAGDCGLMTIFKVQLVLDDNRVAVLPGDIGNFGSDFYPARAFATLLATAMKTKVDDRTNS